jgi:acetylornithine/N-succinyldiaminopimelate aminotransferase
MDNGLLTILTMQTVMRILPPLNVKKKEIDIAVKTIEKVLKEVASA